MATGPTKILQKSKAHWKHGAHSSVLGQVRGQERDRIKPKKEMVDAKNVKEIFKR